MSVAVSRGLLLMVTVLCVSTADRVPPHIVFILADDLGWNDVSYHGSHQIPTPNLDRLAEDGVVLHRYYTHSMCTPSRSALMTGLYSSRTGMQHFVIAYMQPWGLPLNLTLLPQHLKRLGYATHLVGKWHLGYFRQEYTPTFRGFDHHFGSWGGALDYYNHGFMFRNTSWGLDMRHNMTVLRSTHGTYITDLLTDQASKIVQNHDKTQPLFLYLAHNAPHFGCYYSPLQAPGLHVDRMSHIADHRRRMYAAMVSSLDDAVGRVFEALHQQAMLDNTVIVFTSDNGACFPGLWNGSGSNWPLRGTKNTLFEGGIRVPAFVWSPLIEKKGNVVTEMVHVTDWLPTLYQLAGGNVDDLGILDGVDISQTLLQGLPSKRTEIVHRIDPSDNSGALTVGDYKILYGLQCNGLWNNWYAPPTEGDKDPTKATKQCAVARVLERMNHTRHANKDWKLPLSVHCHDQGIGSEPCAPHVAPCIFNIKEDPCEQRNLAKESPEVLQMLLDRVRNHSSWVTYPLNKPDDLWSMPEYHQYVWTHWQDFTDQRCQQDGCSP